MLIKDFEAPIFHGCNFTWEEYALQRMTGELAQPTNQQYQNALFLFQGIQKLIRDPLKKPLLIASGARTKAYTEYLRRHGIPAARQSAHIDWAAVDLRAPSGMTVIEFWKWCRKRWPGRMEDFRFTPQWVHLDTRNWGKRETFKP